MEIKDTLNKPYNENERLEFIIKNNLGYEIKETETALEAWGPTAQEQEEKDKEEHRAELINALAEIDLKAIRSLRAINSGHSTQDDSEKLSELEQQAEAIRQELQEL